MTGREFAIALFHQFGDWPGDGMKNTVADYFESENGTELARLFKWILRYYQPKRQGPPVLAEILAFQRELPIATTPLRIAPPAEPYSDEAVQAFHDFVLKLTGEKVVSRKNANRRK